MADPTHIMAYPQKSMTKTIDHTFAKILVRIFLIWMVNQSKTKYNVYLGNVEVHTFSSITQSVFKI